MTHKVIYSESMKPKEIREAFRPAIYQIVSENKGLDLDAIDQIVSLSCPCDRLKEKKAFAAFHKERQEQILELKQLEDSGHLVNGRIVF